MLMKIIRELAVTSKCYKSGKKISPKGIMLHSVGCNQPDPWIFARLWGNSGDVCPHGVLGYDGTVIQTLPWYWRGWHAGGAANNTHIGIEMCEPSTIKYTGAVTFTDCNPYATRKFIQGTYNTAVELFAHLCAMYSLDPLEDGVIISHKEGCGRGIASNHGDVEHIWDKYGLSMDKFRLDVKAMMEGVNSEESFLVRVSIDDLEIYKSPEDISSGTGLFTGNGIYTILETKNNWGRLKSGVGWICLEGTDRMTT